MVKRFISCLCAVCMMIPAMSPIAIAYDGRFCVSNAKSDINHIINDTAFEDMFQSVSVAPSTNAQRGTGTQPISYSYAIVSTENGTYSTTLDFSLLTDDTKYDFSVGGLCRESKVNETVSVLSGGLQGVNILNGIKYRVYVGFIKSMGDDAITAGVTIVPLVDTNSDDIVRFSFGETVITPDMIENKSAESVGITPELLNATSTRATTDYSLKATAYGSFDSASMGELPSGTAFRVRLYYHDEYARAAVALRTYTTNVNNTFDYLDGSLATYSTSVSEATLGLRRNDSSGVNILNVDSFPAGTFDGSNDDDDDGDSDVGEKLMEFAIEVLGIQHSAAAVILNMFNRASTGVDFTVDPVYGNHAKINLTCGLFETITFDGDNNLTVQFNLTGNGPQTSPFCAYGTVSYTTGVIWPSSYEYFFYETTQATTYAVSLSVN